MEADGFCHKQERMMLMMILQSMMVSWLCSLFCMLSLAFASQVLSSRSDVDLTKSLLVVKSGIYFLQDETDHNTQLPTLRVGKAFCLIQYS